MELRPIRLTVLQPNLAPQKLDFNVPTITLGRATDCTVPIKDRYLSRRHAEIVFATDQWIVRDCGSVNGTLLNGIKINGSSVLKPSDSEVSSQSQLIPLDSNSHAKNLAIPAREAVVDDTVRAGVLAALGMQLIEDRSMSDLFEFILDRVVDVLKPSRAALALFGPDGKTFDNVRVRRRDAS